MTISMNRLSMITRTAAVIFFTAVATLSLHAQQSPIARSPKALDLKTTLAAPLDLSTPDTLSYSSSVGASEAESAEGFNLSASDQPPPRRRYSRRPNYNDRMHNPDGSNKYTFAAGGGFTMPAGATGKELNTSWKFQVGGGYNFNKKFGVLVQYDYDKFGLTGGALTRQFLNYESQGFVDQNGNPLSFAGLDANAHIWSITLNPIYTFYQSDSVGAYVVGGGGFYRKLTNFTLPATGIYCDPFYGFCYAVTENQTFDHYSNNAGGLNGGIGFTYRFSRFASEKLFAEARYVWVDNQPSSNSAAPGNLYPENNHRTGYFPVTVGVRW